MLTKVTAVSLSSSLSADSLFTYTFCSAYARIHTHLWLPNIGPVKGRTPDLQRCQLQLLTVLHCEKQWNDLIKTI